MELLPAYLCPANCCTLALGEYASVSQKAIKNNGPIIG